MRAKLEEHLQSISIPANLRINDQIIKYREYCLAHGCNRPYHHFAFGQSPYSPHPTIIEALASHASEHSYLPIAGLPRLKELISNYYKRHFHIQCSSDQIIVSPGSKEMISILLAVLKGNVIIPTPSWVSYLPQAQILRKNVVTVRTRPENSFKLTPDLLENATSKTQSGQSILILNHPNNPTGAIYSEQELMDLTEVCRRHNLFVISDEIYANTTFEVEQFVSMARVFPEGTVVTGGLSKDRSCGGYRLGVGVFPEKSSELIESVLKVAGSTYSCVSSPIQHAAIAAYSPNPIIDKYMQDCRSVNALVGRKMAALLNAIPGVSTTVPFSGFYLFVDFNDQTKEMCRLGIRTCEYLCEDLLATEHIALLPGNSLLLADDNFAVRCSFVDFDGLQALSAWHAKPPGTAEEEDAFVTENCPLIVDGVRYIARYFETIRNGKRPQHLMDE